MLASGRTTWAGGTKFSLKMRFRIVNTDLCRSQGGSGSGHSKSGHDEGAAACAGVAKEGRKRKTAETSPAGSKVEVVVKGEVKGFTVEERKRLVPYDKMNSGNEVLGSLKATVAANAAAGAKKVEETDRVQQCEECGSMFTSVPCPKEEGEWKRRCDSCHIIWKENTGKNSKKKQKTKATRKPISVPKVKLEEGREKIRELAWGATSTRKQAEQKRRIYEEAMADMQIPIGRWYVFDVATFESFAAWMYMAEGCNYAILDAWTTLLNNVRSREFADSSKPWAKNKAIMDLKEAYRVAEEMRREFEGLKKDERVCMPSDTFVDMVDQAEAEMRKCFRSAEGDALIGITAGQIVQMLFSIRGSTLGAVKDHNDIWVDEHGLSVVIRKIKGWKAGKQHSTGWKVPISRTAELGEHAPWGQNKRGNILKTHIRTQCINIVKEALERECFFRWSGPDEAAGEISKDIKSVGLREVAVGKVVSSHTGRKTGVSVMRAMGVEAEVVQRWMLVSTVKIVEYYRDQDYIATQVMKSLFDWMTGKKA